MHAVAYTCCSVSTHITCLFPARKFLLLCWQMQRTRIPYLSKIWLTPVQGLVHGHVDSALGVGQLVRLRWAHVHQHPIAAVKHLLNLLWLQTPQGLAVDKVAAHREQDKRSQDDAQVSQ